MKTAIVTGSSKGIGLEITHALLADSYRVIGIARTHPVELNDKEDYIPYEVDLAQVSQLEDIFKEITSQYEIDVLICNAGVGIFKSLESFSVKEILEVLHTNFTSHSILVKQVIPSMKQRKSGRILFTGSEASLSGAKLGSIYCASKFALKGFAESVRAECGSSNIAVTSILPGMVDTPFYDNLSFKPGEAPQNAIQAQHISELILFLLNQPLTLVFEEIVFNPMTKVISKK